MNEWMKTRQEQRSELVFAALCVIILGAILGTTMTMWWLP